MAEKNLYTVIVADDEDELREAVCTMIPWEALGFHLVGSASNGLDALELVEQLEPDLLLTDIRMPFITGIELARQVREIRPAMHIAFLSGYDDFEYAKQAIQYNIISYMLKPLTMDGLAAELKSIHERIDHQYASLRRSGIVQEDRASFLIPLVLEHCDNTSDAVEAALRTSAAACGLLRGTDDRSQLVVLTAQPDDNSENAAGFVRMVDQLANKYLRHYAFFCNGHVVAVL
ncbi:MAG: response regulator, partial [Gemmiger sp.]